MMDDGFGDSTVCEPFIRLQPSDVDTLSFNKRKLQKMIESRECSKIVERTFLLSKVSTESVWRRSPRRPCN